MNLRDHPLISYWDVHSWPPVWIQRDPPKKSEGKNLKGEVGVPNRVLRHQAMPNACFLIIEHKGESSMGALMID